MLRKGLVERLFGFDDFFCEGGKLGFQLFERFATSLDELADLAVLLAEALETFGELLAFFVELSFLGGKLLFLLSELVLLFGSFLESFGEGCEVLFLGFRFFDLDGEGSLSLNRFFFFRADLVERQMFLRKLGGDFFQSRIRGFDLVGEGFDGGLVFIESFAGSFDAMEQVLACLGGGLER